MNMRWQHCWEAGPAMYKLIKDSATIDIAREKLINHLDSLDWKYRSDLEGVPSWHYILLKEAVRCMKNIISPRNENLAGISDLHLLWEAANNGDAEVTDDFILEFIHLFKALNGNSVIYPSLLMSNIEAPDFESYKGRTAAVKRSEFLDKMGQRMDDFINRYNSGLDRKVIEKRRENRKRILDYFGATDDDWNNWMWQFKHIFKNGTGLEPLKAIIELTPEEEKAIQLAVEHDVPFGITPHYLHLMDPNPTDFDYSIRRQVIPSLNYVENMKKHISDRDLAFDFMRERDTSPIDLVTRRYPKVAIIKPYDSCPQICVYCQRNWEITSPLMDTAMATTESIDKAIDWFSEHDQMMDVLITGGDPLVMNDKLIESILKRFSEIPHILNIRLATRMPITVPQRFTHELCQIFGDYYKVSKKILCMVTHFSHPYEITPETADVITRVRQQGLYVYNQQVFTFSNSRRFETVALRIAMKKIGVDPYYTFNMKGKSEMQDYAVPIARLIQERKEEARLLPGMFRPDEPVFNVPFLGKNHLRSWQDHELIAIMPDGKRQYSFHPWEKNIDQVKPYLYNDVSIGDYLRKLEARGENIEDYNSIWYYY